MSVFEEYGAFKFTTSFIVVGDFGQFLAIFSLNVPVIFRQASKSCQDCWSVFLIFAYKIFLFAYKIRLQLSSDELKFYFQLKKT